LQRERERERERDRKRQRGREGGREIPSKIHFLGSFNEVK
jgi:hypothetical protein